MTKKSEPVRTCVGCRQRRPAQVLIRVRLHEASLVALDGDAIGATGGRGAWLCRESISTCLTSAARSHAFDRAFRRRIPPDAVDALIAGLVPVGID